MADFGDFTSVHYLLETSVYRENTQTCEASFPPSAVVSVRCSLTSRTIERRERQFPRRSAPCPEWSTLAVAKTPTAALPLRARVAAAINGQELVAQRPVPRRDSAKTLGLFEGDTYSPSQLGGQSPASHPKGAQTVCRLRSKPVAFAKTRAFHQGDTGLLRNDSSGRGEPPSSPGNTEQRGGPVSFVPGSIASRSTRWIRNRENLGALGAWRFLLRAGANNLASSKKQGGICEGDR